MSTGLAALRQILATAHESQILEVTWNTDIKANLKQPSNPARTTRAKMFLLGSGTQQPGLLHVKHKSSGNVGRYPELYLEQTDL